MSDNDLALRQAAGALAEGSPVEGSPAERLRSLLVAADSLTLLTSGHRADLVGRHRIDGDGRLTVELPADSGIAGQLRREPELVAVVEITDIAPTAVRDRIRGRATLSGWLTPAGGPDRIPGVDHRHNGDLPAVLDLATAELSIREQGIREQGVHEQGVRGQVVRGRRFDIEPEDVAAARPDPLALREADLLGHLTDHHRPVVDRLTRLVPVAHLQGVRRVHPVRLDRYGLVLRLEYAGRDRDVRLPFASPLDHADELETRMRGLLALARRCRRERTGGP